ncbi:hypothetical protein HU200_008402 [Digitaria exilis]|uniref:PGG domain-containing protein n=1 Tax=Digitaria exilis TaxID=1010633 RepID=A0A835KNZ0_9POAL|nr:hypothetical protein HU200_008402 [Digitaria exilis]
MADEPWAAHFVACLSLPEPDDHLKQTRTGRTKRHLPGGLVPPGGFWLDNRHGHAAGNPILQDSNNHRYHIFFNCNSTSFATSIAVIALLILELIHLAMKNKDDGQRTLLIHAAHYMMLLDLVGLLGAYASGSSREWETSGYIVAVVAAEEDVGTDNHLRDPALPKRRE